MRDSARSSTASVPDDLAKLGPDGVKKLLELMRDAYFDLLKTRKVDLSMDENDITEEWFVWLQIHWRESNISLIPIHEKPDKSKSKKRGKPPTIDFCFRSRWDKRSYFGAECKLIEANNKTLCDKYVENGMNRYIDGRYSQKRRVLVRRDRLGHVPRQPLAEQGIELGLTPLPLLAQ